MNYHLQLVTGADAQFFLDEWPAGGVEISDRVVGLFDAAGPRQSDRLVEALALYGVAKVSFGLTDLLKIGFAKEWTWLDIRWLGAGPAVQSEHHVRDVLGPGLHEDKKRQVRLLQIVQATAKRLGTPTLIQGCITRPGGRQEKISVYATGLVAYDRTPHPVEFLRAVAAVVSP